MDWNQIVERVTPLIVKIETPAGHGTGFVCYYDETRNLCGIATAHHVVEHAERWQQAMRIHHFPSSKFAFLKEADRVIFFDQQKDSAFILMEVGELDFPENLIQLLPTDNRLPIGAEVGWLGYPAMGPDTLCFFSGNVSAWQGFRHAYLIDGVAINGVSGGPVVYSTPTEGVQIVGTISAYMPNQAIGGSLPGLSVAQDVSHFHDIASKMRNFVEARRQQAATSTASVPPSQ